MSRVPDSDLDALLDHLARTAEAAPPAPRFERAAADPCGPWLAQVRRARGLADRSALEHRARLDAAARELFGTTAAALLGQPRRRLERRSVDVAVPTAAGLAELVENLPVSVPAGPPPQCADSQPRVQVHLTTPPHPTAGVVRLHGGAFWMGGGQVARTIDRTLVDHVADVANAVVFDVDHRLAPEHPFPAAVADVLAVLDAVRAGLGGVPDGPLGLLGTSSGANIATLAARLDGHRAAHPPLAALALVVPSVELQHASTSMLRDPDAWAHRLDQLRGYLGPHIDPADTWISPGTLEFLPAMPPTFAVTAQFDDVAAGGEGLVAAIVAAGTPAQARSYPMTHTTATPQVEAQYIRDVASFLRDALPPR